MKKFVDDNRGVTLVELLVVIAILSIAVGFVSYGISFAFSRDAEKCAKTIDIQLSNISTLSGAKKGDYTLRITPSSGENRLEVYSSAQGNIVIEKVSLQERVNISFFADGVPVTTDWIEITFKKSGGAVKKILRSDGTEINPAILTVSASNASGKLSEVVVVSLTGKHYVE